jgi:hypothetical protein
MPYRLKRGESVPGGLKRIAGEQIEAALKQLNGKNTNRDEAIHEARKCVKRTVSFRQACVTRRGAASILGHAERSKSNTR